MTTNLYLANTLQLEFLSGGYVQLGKKWYCKEKAFQLTRLYYIYSGSAELFYKGETITMVPGNLYLLPTGLPVAYSCPEAMGQFFLHVTLITPEGFDMLSGLKKVCRLPCSKEQLEQLKRLYYSEDYKHLLAFKSQVTQDVVSCLLREDVSFQTKPYSAEVLQAISYIQNNISIQLSGEQIAKAIFISPSRLHKRFKAETGLTLGAYQDRLIFYRATQLLAEKKLSIKEISQQLGFCDEHYFSRRFKEKMGMTPTGYRRHHLT